MNKITCLCVGKLNSSALSELESEYLKRTPHIKRIEVKAKSENAEAESRALLKKYEELAKGGSSKLIILEEHGREFDSLAFAHWLAKNLDNGQSLYFAIGGASGHDTNLRSLADERLSLSKLTMPHKFARIVLLEQLFRANTILTGHPYHK